MAGNLRGSNNIFIGFQVRGDTNRGKKTQANRKACTPSELRIIVLLGGVPEPVWE
ncbi:MAG: hypothetical protein HLUCCX10_03035 [Algoriphagus marincola HL-49]|uniref:Uncharacterized protein n=1 Tax=Algoriphagus marincola HL-49 TaxID=1305737 RepID=A0A0P8AT14_9BACT|nr:MAG: hypothetical protein HLUCCX10_03035 [Algoriphagus marincola HL-49]